MCQCIYIENICIFFDQNGMRLEDNYKEKKTKKQNNASKPINTWRLLNNQLVTEEINEEIKKKKSWRQ